MNSVRTESDTGSSTSGNGRNTGSGGGRKRNPEREQAILDAALALFGERGFADTTVSQISSAAGVSDATVYEYFESKEQVLFSIAEHYTRNEFDRVSELAHYVHDPVEMMRAIIQAYLEFYENNPLYTSVAMLTLKANRNFTSSAAYTVIKEASRPLLDAFDQGVEAGVFRADIDRYLVRNLVLGFIEHLTTQWLMVGRPEQLAGQRDTIHEMVMRAIAAAPGHGSVVTIKVRGATELEVIPSAMTDTGE